MWLMVVLLLAHDKSGEAIVARNIFCSDCKSVARAKPKDVQLLATIVARESFAIVRTREVVAVVPGSRIGDAVVQTIEERRIVFEDGDWVGFERAVAAIAQPAAVIDRATITNVLAHPEELVRTVTAVPGADGIRIVALRPQSPLMRLGIQRGDVVRAVNGCELFGIDASLACYQKLRNARFVSVALVRAGKPVTLDVTLDRE